MWVQFTATRDWKPSPQVTIALVEGLHVNWNRDLAQKAIDAGVAKPMKKVGKGKPVEDAGQG